MAKNLGKELKKLKILNPFYEFVAKIKKTMYKANLIKWGKIKGLRDEALMRMLYFKLKKVESIR